MSDSLLFESFQDMGYVLLMFQMYFTNVFSYKNVYVSCSAGRLFFISFV